MKFQRRLLRGENADAFRQMVIEGPDQVGAGNRGSQLDAGRLFLSVNPGIGSPGPADIHRLPAHFPDRLGQSALDGGPLRLDLPAIIIRSLRDRNSPCTTGRSVMKSLSRVVRQINSGILEELFFPLRKKEREQDVD